MKVSDKMLIYTKNQQLLKLHGSTQKMIKLDWENYTVSDIITSQTGIYHVTSVVLDEGKWIVSTFGLY